MNIDDLKKELHKVRAPKMDTVFPSGKAASAAEFFERLRRQERKDEKFLLYKRIIPILVGLVILGIGVIGVPIRAPVMFTGAALLFLSMLAALLLFFKDYRDISKETFDSSLAQFLREKEKRLSYWRSTPFIHQLAFALFLIGWLLINVGNKPFIRTIGGFPFVIFVGAALAIIILSNINSERLYRKRHKREHEPLLQMIAEIRESSRDEK
jgi:peptidoglycan/LPS O-acetylase OafA/YrhL